MEVRPSSRLGKFRHHETRNGHSHCRARDSRARCRPRREYSSRWPERPCYAHASRSDDGAQRAASVHSRKRPRRAQSRRYPKPPGLRLPETQKLSDGELFWIIENGVRFTGMPAFATHGAEDDSWKLVLFIRHLPHLTAEERTEMERYNPKGPEDRAAEQQEEDFLNGAAPQPNSDAPHHLH